MGSDAFLRIPIRKSWVFALVAVAFVALVTVVVGEILVSLVNAQPYMMPRYQFSHLYGHKLPANTVMTASRPGHWEFHYTVNEYGYRGPAIPISNIYAKTNIVLLGDSYTMGVGVNDDEPYAAVLARELSTCFDVVNLGVGGYGLTHEIRRFYEFGLLYQPSIVVLQFFHNDPADDLADSITRVRNGKFEFAATSQGTGWLKSALSDSVIQYSQIYNLIRNAGYRALRQRRLSASETSRTAAPTKDGPARGEMLYLELLETFAADLARRDIDLFMIAVNGSLDRYPAIRRGILELHELGQLRYLETADWLQDLENYGSPEGHSWGPIAHREIGENLARVVSTSNPVQAAFPETSACPTPGKGSP